MRFLSVLLMAAVPAVAAAQGIVIPRCVPRPLPMERDDRPIAECLPMRAQVVRTRSDVRVELRDRVLRYEVEERFVNRGGLIGEADYIFPLPKNAAFRDLKLSIDGQMVSGETMSATDARRIYEEIVRRQRDPALVEWMGHGMLRTRIFPIQAGEERRVVVRFESVADREGDALRVDYFRGTAPENGGNPRPWIVQPAYTGESKAPRGGGTTTMTLTYRTGGELGEPYSPTHELDVEREDLLRRVHVHGGGPDITLLVALRKTTSASVGLLANARHDEPGYALITVTPPAELSQTRTPRDLTFVVDVSGSMSGHKLEQAKGAGRRILQTLTPQDRFRLIDFSTDVRWFRDDFVFATESNVRAALRYLDDLEASGSTNISGALEEALRQTAHNGPEGFPDDVSNYRPRSVAQGGRLPLLLFITDGEPTIGERDPAAIVARASRMRGDARIFTFGLGADVNVGLIEQLALEGHGLAQFVRPDESIERQVELLAARLRQPLLTDVRITVDGNVHLSRVMPTGAQDIFAGQDLVMLARYEGNGHANVVVQGREAGGREVRWSNDRNFPAEEHENAFVPRLWATQRIGWLVAEKRRNGASSEIDDEIRQLGERFGIPTEFTSYLVQEPGHIARMDNATTLSGRGMTAGAAPAPMVAFESAKKASAQRAARSIADVDATSFSSVRGEAETRHVGMHVFRIDGDRWVDVTLKPALQVYKVQAYSRSYFALVERLPELRGAFAIGAHVVVAGRNVAVEVVDDGRELNGSEIDAIATGW